MNPEERSLLERTYKMVEENNTILRSIRRTGRIGIAIKVFYWVIIIGISIGAFYFIQPYIDAVKNIGVDNRDGSSTSSYAENFQSMFDLFK
jgi:hypothetical protein